MASADRRWYQFRLRTLLLLVTAAALAVLAYRTYLEPYAQQRRAMEVIEELHGTYQSSGPSAWQRRLFGDDHQNVTLVYLADSDAADRYLPYVARLPAIEALVVGGQAFDDSHLRRLSGLSTLRELVLDSTSVTPETVAAWRERLPDVKVYFSQRRAIRDLRASGWAIVGKATPAAEQAAQWPLTAALDNALGPDFFVQAELAIGRPADDDALAPLRHLATLRTLSLNSKITDGGLRHLRPLADLDYLDVMGSQITDAGLAELTCLTNLVYLDIASTRVTDSGLAHLRALPKLGWLNLSRTQVTHAGLLKNVAPLKGLRMLYIYDTPVALQDAAALDAMLRPCVLLGPESSQAGEVAAPAPSGARRPP